jgi:hypothetical protein
VERKSATVLVEILEAGELKAVNGSGNLETQPVPLPPAWSRLQNASVR